MIKNIKMLLLGKDIIRIIIMMICDYQTICNLSHTCRDLHEIAIELNMWRIRYCLFKMKLGHFFQPDIWASQKGYFNVLDWLLNYHTFKINGEKISIEASSYGHISVLELWKNHFGFRKLPPNPIHIDKNFRVASCAGKIDILNWWEKYIEYQKYLGQNAITRQNTLSHYCDSYTIDSICKTPHTESLNWWLDYCDKYNIKFKYTSDAIRNASLFDRIEILDWFLNYCNKTGRKFKYPLNIVDEIITHGNIRIMEWWGKYFEQMKIPFKYSKYSINIAQHQNNLDVIKWIYNYCQKTNTKFKYNVKTIENATKGKFNESVKWWVKYFWENDFDMKKNCIYELKYYADEIKQISLPPENLLHLQEKIYLLYQYYLEIMINENRSNLNFAKSRKIEKE